MDAVKQAPLILPKMQDPISLTIGWRSVDARLTLIVRMWLGASVSVFCTSRQLIRWKWTVKSPCQYFTINSGISECEQKCETRPAEPEIGPNRACQTRQNPGVDRYGSGIGAPRVNWSCFWPGLERNRPVFAVQTRTTGGLPWAVANTTCTPLRYVGIYALHLIRGPGLVRIQDIPGEDSTFTVIWFSWLWALELSL
jgi:hypothetical protein